MVGDHTYDYQGRPLDRDQAKTDPGRTTDSRFPYSITDTSGDSNIAVYTES